MDNYKDITSISFEFEDGRENPSGIQEEVLLVPVSSLETEAVPVDNITTAEGIVTITADHILKAGKAPIVAQPLSTKSGVNTKLSGEELSKVFETDTELFVPQISAKMVGGAAAIKNTRFLIFVRRIGQRTGHWQIGSKGMPAKVQDIAGGFGVGNTAEVGFKIILKAFDVVPFFDYQGEIPAPAPVVP